jgi:Transposase IS116/IS110/IS902 family
MGNKMADNAHRDGVAERLAAPAVHKSLAVARALLPYDEERLRDVALPIVTTATHHDAQTLSLRQTVPGLGQILRLVRLYAIHAMARCPRGQAFASSCRLVKGAKASAGQRSGPSGSQIGHAPLTGAFAAAAGFVLRENPAGQQRWTSLEKKPSTGQALPILAHQWARAVSSMVPRQTAFALATFLQGYGRGVGEPHAALDRHGMPLLLNARAGGTPAARNAPARLGREPCALAWMRHRRPLLVAPGRAAPGGLPAPACAPPRLACSAHPISRVP